VVGVEVLGRSGRTADPAEATVRVAGVAEVLDKSDPLAAALQMRCAALQHRRLILDRISVTGVAKDAGGEAV